MNPIYDPNNIFAKILRGEIPSHRVYEDDRCVAILDIAPVNPGHTLVIPKAQAVLMSQLDAELAAHLMVVGQRLGNVLREQAPHCEGLNFWISDGAAAGQEVPHVHLHVIPRFVGDGFGWKSGPHNRQPQDSTVQAALAERVRKAL